MSNALTSTKEPSILPTQQKDYQALQLSPRMKLYVTQSSEALAEYAVSRGEDEGR
jgi:hypothetical protein